jgi:hypothetical protein
VHPEGACKAAGPRSMSFGSCEVSESSRGLDGQPDPSPPGGVYFCLAGHHAEILQKPDRPLPCPYLPTYLPTLLMGN